MAIKKYKTFEEAEEDLWTLHTDENYYEKMKALFEMWEELSEGKKKETKKRNLQIQNNRRIEQIRRGNENDKRIIKL